jgi:hypothetical protein
VLQTNRFLGEIVNVPVRRVLGALLGRRAVVAQPQEEPESRLSRAELADLFEPELSVRSRAQPAIGEPGSDGPALPAGARRPTAEADDRR